MNISEKDQISPIVDNLCAIDIEGKIIEVVGKDADLNQIIYDCLSIADYVKEIPLIANNFKAAFTSDLWKYIPYNWNHPVHGGGPVFAHINHIYHCLTTNLPLAQYGHSIQYLKLYELNNGLYKLSKTPVEKITQEQLKKKEIELSLTEKQIKLREVAVAELISAIGTEKTALQGFLEQKQTELKTISDTLATVSSQKTDIDSIHKGVQQVDSDIRTTQKNQNDLYEQLKTQKEGQEKEFKTLTGLLDDEKSKLQKAIESGEEKVKYFLGLEDFIKAKQKEIIDLGALAAGAALGGTFGLREGKLNDGLKFWKWAVPGITVLAMTWVLIVFTCLKSNTGNITVDVLLNLAKTIPAFVLMGFVFKQYSKERNLQEEYAFKAAIANTIKAYSDLLTGEDKPENASKQAMLKDIIKRVQTPPKLYHESGGKIFSFSTKGLSDSIKNLNEVIKNINPK